MLHSLLKENFELKTYLNVTTSLRIKMGIITGTPKIGTSIVYQKKNNKINKMGNRYIGIYFVLENITFLLIRFVFLGKKI